MVLANVMAKGTEASIAVSTPTDEGSAFYVRTSDWRSFLKRLKLSTDKISAHAVKSALWRKAIVLFAYMQGEIC